MTKNIKHEFKVSLVELGGVRVIDVDHHKDGHPVAPHEEPQSMVWKLTGNASGCAFLPIGPQDPGFEWIAPKPKGGIFGKPQISPTGGELTITNTHKKNGDSKGEFIYKLRIKDKSGTYTTLHTLDKAEPTPVDDGAGQNPQDPCNRKKRVTTNPRIKNT